MLAAVAALCGAGAARAADLTVWGLQAFNPAADEFIGQMVKDFGASKGVSAEYVVVPASVLNDRLAAAFQGGLPPDAFMQVGPRAQFYIGANLVVPLDDVLADMRKVPGGIAENQLPAGRAGNTYQALPVEIDVVPMFARKDLLAEVGKGMPQTWAELRADAKLIHAKHPQIAGLGMTVSNAVDAEMQMRSVIWAFGGKVMADDGKTVVFNSPETRAAYQFVADMFLEDHTIPRAALTWDDSGNNVAYQTGRAAFVINAPSIWYWLGDNDKALQGNTEMISAPRGPGAKGRVANSTSAWVWEVSKAGKHQDLAKDWLRYFYQPDHYRAVIEKVGGRWAPVYNALFDSMPMFNADPAFHEFKAIAGGGVLDGFSGPPNVMAGRVIDANVITKVLQKVLVDHTPVDQAAAWGQAQIEALAKAD